MDASIASRCRWQRNCDSPRIRIIRKSIVNQSDALNQQVSSVGHSSFFKIEVANIVWYLQIFIDGLCWSSFENPFCGNATAVRSIEQQCLAMNVPLANTEMNLHGFATVFKRFKMGTTIATANLSVTSSRRLVNKCSGFLETQRYAKS